MSLPRKYKIFDQKNIIDKIHKEFKLNVDRIIVSKLWKEKDKWSISKAKDYKKHQRGGKYEHMEATFMTMV